MTSLVVRGRPSRRLANSLAIAALACELSAAAAGTAVADTSVSHHAVYIDGVRVAYREAGPRTAPVVLLLHGFPSSSFMYRDLMPRLADRWHVVAPDYPGFGDSDFPPAGEYEYSFAQLTRTVDRFTTALGLTKYALYIQDYGAPVGLRLALAFVVCHLIGRAYSERALVWFGKYLGYRREQMESLVNGFDKVDWFIVPWFAGSNIVAAILA